MYLFSHLALSLTRAPCTPVISQQWGASAFSWCRDSWVPHADGLHGLARSCPLAPLNS